MASLKKKSIAHILIAIKSVIMLAIVIFIYLKLKDQHNFSNDLLETMGEGVSNNPETLAIALMLMPLNWLLEALKWKRLSHSIANLTLKQSISGVLVGLCLGFVTPHGVGDYFGRVLIVKNTSRSRLIGGVLVSRIAQLLATLVFGLIGIWILFEPPVFIAYITVLSSFIVTILLLLNLDYPHTHIRWVSKIGYYLSIIKEYRNRDLVIVTSLACLRYMVFCLQLVLVIHAFVPDVDWLINLGGSTWIFLSKSVLPTFNFLSDLGVREFSAIYFFEQFNAPIISILSATLLIWLINILIPTLVGIPFIMRLKIKS